MTSTKTKPGLDEAVASLRRALRPFKGVMVAAGVNDEIVIELGEETDDNDLAKARAMVLIGWEGWSVTIDGPGLRRDLGSRRWG